MLSCSDPNRMFVNASDKNKNMNGINNGGGGGGAASGCSDFREINDAKVATILAYLDNTLVGPTAGLPMQPPPLGKPQPAALRQPEERDGSVSDAGQEAAENSTSIPLTASALQHITRVGSVPSLSSSAGAGSARQQQHVSSLLFACQAQGIESAQSTYLGIKSKIEGLQFDKTSLQKENAELRQRLEVQLAGEDGRREELKAMLQQDAADLRQELRLAKKREKQAGDAWRAEREQLARQIDALSSQLRKEMASRAEEQQKLEAAHAAALNTLKGKWQAQEKAARDKWKVAEAKRIKETTLQSLEPDIVLLLNRHKAEKARLRESYEDELRQRDEVIAAKDAAVEELRAKLQRDAEAVLQREQQTFEERLREETDRVRRTLDDERRHAKSKLAEAEHFFSEEKRVLQQEVARLGSEVLRLRQAETTDQAAFHEAVSKEVAKITGESSAVMATLKERMLRELASREAAAQEQVQRHLAEKELELRKRYELERDTAITHVVQKLQQEHLRTLTHAQGNDGMLRERYAQLGRDKERLHVELELVQGQLRGAQHSLEEKDRELQQVREHTDTSAQKISAIEKRVAAEYEAKLVVQENEWRARLQAQESDATRRGFTAEQQAEELRQAVQRARAEAEAQQKQLEQRHFAELSQINERVLVALTKKDHTIQHQSQQLLALQEAVELREQELGRHRHLLQLEEP
ncbi:5-azacytidine induced 1 [Strigomonas culicis]|uniref:5-azacytidine induced 1 n=1 Tax=Strigomonas culicis TaxID=28005 RepID=S9TVI4_9TRYP|nr:5-azacytidine induced 1 [Strigomonas culicis]EPY22709.1 5-azacytidine induced 1 [Strigomonas culicis]|eukprot:EPY20569.1 5-azacytidine induced 1 [Strigomonas culicis]